MSVPGIVQSALEDEEIVARVSIGGDDEFFVTGTNSLVYRSDGLLSDESVDRYPHEADRVTISEGRRKTRFSLEYPLEGTREFTVPSSVSDEVLNPLMAGVLAGNDVTDPGESVIETYRFSELTLIVTSGRLVKHIGEAVWDEEFEQYQFGDVTNLAFEDGSVATQIVLTVGGRPERIKAPNEQVDNVRRRLEDALFDYHDVDSLPELNEVVADDDPEPTAEDPSEAFGDGVDPLSANPPTPEDEPESPDQTVETEPTGESAGRSVSVESTATEETAAATTTADSSVTEELSSGSADAEPAAVNAGVEPDSSDIDPLGEPAESTAAVETVDSAETEPDDIVEDEPTDVIETETSDPETTSESPTKQHEPSGFGESGFEAATARTDPELLERIETLERTVDRQTELLEHQQRTIEQLIEELRQGR